ncbi:hydroxyethylthiazole kinase [Rhinocladiella mackenziei CBS 650.93]|uniref:Hydroxyethylthiazole kinase n=1 Tax=Rhinocladiella mackenziei CBS 650.93 TaxID=1442369 RepID=A0A0D2H0F0_9EURO|nr:hydroxyethylthiazole kinase [Rhinocladiella mackenziei CBS 650.93]KIX03898.1 hydroxyethylthiazole kinase [Rhinocladiella mackenziei CBS 650.93]
MLPASTSIPPIDWSLYLVTDSTPAILGGKDLVQVVDQAIQGGVSIVQYRDKHADTRLMIDVATKLHNVTQKNNIPLLINDRLDVCMAVGAEGVHIGQDDMDCAQARKILGPDAIIGVTASSVDEAAKAIQDGANYLGIGTTFATPTKTDTKSIIGTRGLRQILSSCSTGTEKSVPCVAIGSINASNVQRVLHQSAYGSNRLNGVAVVSAIMASTDPQSSARTLLDLIKSTPETYYTAVPPSETPVTDLESLKVQIPSIIKSHFSSSVICHNMTNTVVQNFVANVCLASGSSPIMSENGAEASDLAQLGGTLVINMGTATADKVNAFIAGMKAYNAAGAPIVFDPVGGGATAFRRDTVKKLLSSGFFSVIKGNEGEIGSVAGTSTTQQRGVESGPSVSSADEKAQLVQTLAQRENCVVLMTGKTDYLSDGARTVTISNGSPLLGKITGSGCALGAVVASYLALHREDKLLAALSGVLHFEIAAERAEARADCRGPGSFIPAFLDELYLLGEEIKKDELSPKDFAALTKVELIMAA